MEYTVNILNLNSAVERMHMAQTLDSQCKPISCTSRTPSTAECRLQVHLITASPRVSRELKVLPLAPYALKSYALWRMAEEDAVKVEITVTVFDPETSPEEMAANLQAAHIDVAAFSVYVWNHRECLECARILSERQDSPYILFGGPQVSPVAHDLLLVNDFIDAVTFVTVPGETIFYHFLMARLSGYGLDSVAGLSYRDANGSIHQSSEIVEQLDLTKVPSPYLDGTVELEPDKEYHVTIETSRGCPLDCAYCFWGSGASRVEFPPLERVLAEIDWIYEQKSIKHVFFTEFDMLLKYRRNEVIAKHLWLRKGSFKPEFDTDVRNIVPTRRSLALSLHRLPGFFFKFAVQTANPDAWKHLGSNRATPEMFPEKARLLRSWIPDAEIVADIMLPLPGDDLAGLRQTTNLVLSLEPNQIFLNYPVYLLPGTHFFNEKDNLGLVYQKEPPNSVLETETFPLSDVDTALKLSFWVQIITYYHPAVADCFFAICRQAPEIRHIDRLESWFQEVEKRIQLMSNYQNLPQLAVQSVEDLNTVKGAILRQACEVESCQAIYAVILRLESSRFANNFRTPDLVDFAMIPF